MASTPVGKGMNLFRYFGFNKDVDKPKHTRTILLTIFTLIAATTFQAGVNPPGGVWQEDPLSPNSRQAFLNHTEAEAGIIHQPPPTEATTGVQPPPPPPADHPKGERFAGAAIFSLRKTPYYVFLLSNTFAFSNSILVILSLTHNFPFNFEIRAATLSMAVTYGSAVFAVTPNASYRFRFVLTVAFLPFAFRLLISVYNFWYSKMSQPNKVVPHTSDPIEVKIPSGLPPVSRLSSSVARSSSPAARSSPINRRSVNISEIV